MRRPLLRSNAFVRAAKRRVRKDPRAAEDIRAALESLAGDAFHPQLHTHKLTGKLRGSWACSASYDLRIVFKFVEHEGKESILLESVGTHEEVY